MWKLSEGAIGNLCRDPLTALAVAAVVGTGASIYQGERQASAAKSARGEASRKAQEEVAIQKTERDQARQKQKGKAQRVASLARGGGRPGQGAPGTRLTGAGGIDPSLLNLAQNTLLG